MDRLKAGVIIDDHLMPAWVVKTLELIIDTPHFYIAFIIRNSPASQKPLPFLYSQFVKRGEGAALNIPDAFEMTDASSLLNHLPQIAIVDLEAIKEHRPDMIINLSATDAPKGLLGIAPYGVWSYFHSIYKDSPVPGAWEVVKRDPITVSGVEAALADGTRKTIYKSYALTDPSSIKKSRNRYYWKSVSFIPRLLERLYSDRAHFLERTVLEDRQQVSSHSGAPSNIQFATAFLKTTFKRVINKLKRPPGKADWILMYKNWRKTNDPFSLEGYKPLLPPAGRFWADPHLVFENGTYYIFIEDYDYAAGRGHIAVVELDEQGNYSEAVPVLKQPYHMSYPFVFQHEGKWYMIPETSENRTIELYECESFPYKWTFKKNLAENITAVDTTVLHHNNKWWFFTNIEKHPGAMSLDELFIFYTDDILNGTLQPHKQNPVVTDVRSARPAGKIFTVQGKMMRPSQICAPYYGWGTSINEITVLSETNYKEQQTIKIAPSTAKKITGVHTISIVNDLAVIDALSFSKK